jgi:glutamate-1-semialdehyde 2,1-aminomutase
MAAGIATLEDLRRGGVYTELEMRSRRLEEGIARAAESCGKKVKIARIGSLLTVFFMSNLPADYESAKNSDVGKFAKFFNALLERGVYWPPSQFEAAFVSLAHSEEDIAATISAMKEALTLVS